MLLIRRKKNAQLSAIEMIAKNCFLQRSLAQRINMVDL